MLQSYLLMFIHSSPSLLPNEDYDRILEHALNTYTLGEHVAPKWELGKVLKWKPMNVGNFSKPLGPDVEIPSLLNNVRGENARSVGMYKVQGTTVEAVVGGVFHQFVRTLVHPALRISLTFGFPSRVDPSPTVSSTHDYSPTYASREARKVSTHATTSMLWRSPSVWAAVMGRFCDDLSIAASFGLNSIHYLHMK